MGARALCCKETALCKYEKSFVFKTPQSWILSQIFLGWPGTSRNWTWALLLKIFNHRESRIYSFDPWFIFEWYCTFNSTCPCKLLYNNLYSSLEKYCSKYNQQDLHTSWHYQKQNELLWQQGWTQCENWDSQQDCRHLAKNQRNRMWNMITKLMHCDK